MNEKIRATKMVPVLAEKFEFDKYPWPGGVHQDVMTKSMQGVCSLCNLPFNKHAGLALGMRQTARVCPGSYIVREIHNTTTPYVVDAEQFRTHYRLATEAKDGEE